jgi:putative tryptophan/tyrosine transport system substrate-binding protein
MRRREFISVFGSTVFAWPLAARAQQSSNKIPVVGVLWHAGSAEEERVPLGALVQGFRNLGYVEDRNIIFEHRFPNEQPELLRYSRRRVGKNYSRRRGDVRGTS